MNKRTSCWMVVAVVVTQFGAGNVFAAKNADAGALHPAGGDHKSAMA